MDVLRSRRYSSSLALEPVEGGRESGFLPSLWTRWRIVSCNENLALRIAKRACSCANWLGVCPDGQLCEPQPQENSDASRRKRPQRARPQAAPILSIDELRLVIFIIRCARVIAFLQRFVPERYLPPKEDRIPPSLLKRLIHELKKLIPKWKWIPSARELPRSPVRLGDELFYAITALRMSRLEIWRADYTDCVAVLDEAYSLLYSIGIRIRERKHRSKGQQVAVKRSETPRRDGAYWRGRHSCASGKGSARSRGGHVGLRVANS